MSSPPHPSSTAASSSPAIPKGTPMRVSHILAAIGESKLKITALETEVEDVRGELASVKREMRQGRDVVNAVAVRLKELEAEAERRLDEEASTEEELDENAEGDDASSVDSDEVVTEEDRERIKRSVAAYADNIMKELVRECFRVRLGVAKLKAASLPMYPVNVEEWPMEVGSDGRTRLLRFRWEQPWNDDGDNYYAIRMLVGHIKRHGTGLIPAAATAIKGISEDDLQKRVVAKYKGLQKELRAAKLMPGIAVSGAVPPSGENADIEPTLAAVPAAPGVVSKATLASRARGKLAVRVRQRGALPAESPYRDKKYDTAFIVSAMSDDEDEYKDGKRTGKYVTRPPAYRSEEMKALLAAVDATSDPDPQPKYTVRVVGEPQFEPPKASTVLEYRARRWMVDAEWLQNPDNHQYDIEKRIMASGVAWGDREEPEVGIKYRSRVKDVKGDIAKKEKKRLAEPKESAGEGSKKPKKKAKKAAAKRKGAAGKGKQRASTVDLEDSDVLMDE
ncbi:hypothetical protein PLICRDRAFT_36907 [Plicaturopsis crispa FD-325 SS-3]|nr:hypothetical protein PLICRDRAFT_36907 [Plicaturopsis crispa FD-325 SS-3]